MSASTWPSPDPAGYIPWAGTVGFSSPPAAALAVERTRAVLVEALDGT